MRYAEIRCDSCHVILPGNLMTIVSDRVVKGQSVRPVTKTKHYTSGQSYQETKNETTTHYGFERSHLCPDCLAARRRRQFLKALFIVSLIVAGVSWVAFRSDRPSKAGAADSQRSGNLSSDVDENLTTTPSNSLLTADGEQSSQIDGIDSSLSVNEESEMPATPARAVSQQVTAFAADTPQIAAAMAKAAEKGRSIEWKIGNRRGYAVASVAQSDGCKNAYFSDEAMGKNWVSETQTICP